jgi:hypothetical protein
MREVGQKNPGHPLDSADTTMAPNGYNIEYQAREQQEKKTKQQSRQGPTAVQK